MTVGFFTLKAENNVPMATSHLKRNNLVHYRETTLNNPVLANVCVDSIPPYCFATQMRIFQESVMLASMLVTRLVCALSVKATNPEPTQQPLES